MPAVSPLRLRPLLNLSLMLSLCTSPLFVPISYAEDSTQRRSYEVPAGSLSAALTRFAGLAGVNLSVDPALVSGRSSAGLSGEYAVEEGFAQLLGDRACNCKRWASRRTSWCRCRRAAACNWHPRRSSV